jgi:hypothetical protein
MNYTRAKLIIWNPDAYERDQVREAALYIVSQLHARREDLDQAALVFCH